jgi:hypothetical protein
VLGIVEALMIRRTLDAAMDSIITAAPDVFLYTYIAE